MNIIEQKNTYFKEKDSVCASYLQRASLAKPRGWVVMLRERVAKSRGVVTSWERNTEWTDDENQWEQAIIVFSTWYQGNYIAWRWCISLDLAGNIEKELLNQVIERLNRQDSSYISRKRDTESRERGVSSRERAIKSFFTWFWGLRAAQTPFFKGK